MSVAENTGGRTKKGQNLRRFHHRMPGELYDWLEEQAELRGVSMALLVNRAIDHYREVLPPPPPAVGEDEDLLAQATAALRAGR